MVLYICYNRSCNRYLLVFYFLICCFLVSNCCNCMRSSYLRRHESATKSDRAVHVDQTYNSISPDLQTAGWINNYTTSTSNGPIINGQLKAGRSLLQQQEPPPLIIVQGAADAVCLDGSPPAYSLDQGSGSGQNKWIVHLQGGGWCGSLSDCLQRSSTNLGSSKFMSAVGFGGLLSNSPSSNPDFYNWNRVHVRYCDGGSFAGNSVAQTTGSDGQATTLYFKGQQVWETIIDNLLAKGLASAEKAILSGDSAGGLAAFFHCNRFKEKLSKNIDVRCLADGSFFMDIPNIGGAYTFRDFFQDIVDLHNIALPTECASQMSKGQCFFPENNIGFINAPFFFAQSSYDSFQVEYILAPPGSYSNGSWDGCRQNLALCSDSQMSTIDDQLRGKMLTTLKPLIGSKSWGMHVVSCYYHTEAIDDNIWNGITKINEMNVAQAFHSWYFEDSLIQEIDCAYPCNPTCTTP